MVMNDLFRPTDRALAFGEQYAEVLGRWSELFKAASELVDANVQLGRMTTDAAKEFDQLLRGTANAPWNWLGPDMVQRFMEAMAPRAKPPAD